MLADTMFELYTFEVYTLEVYTFELYRFKILDEAVVLELEDCIGTPFCKIGPITFRIPEIVVFDKVVTDDTFNPPPISIAVTGLIVVPIPTNPFRHVIAVTLHVAILRDTLDVLIAPEFTYESIELVFINGCPF